MYVCCQPTNGTSRPFIFIFIVININHVLDQKHWTYHTFPHFKEELRGEVTLRVCHQILKNTRTMIIGMNV